MRQSNISPSSLETNNRYFVYSELTEHFELLLKVCSVPTYPIRFGDFHAHLIRWQRRHELVDDKLVESISGCDGVQWHCEGTHGL